MDSLVFIYGNAEILEALRLAAMTSSKLFLLLGAVNAALAVLIGAFGAHALKARLSVADMAIFQTGSQYHFYHALGLLAVGLILASYPSSAWIKASGWLMLIGIILFSGSLYVLVITQLRWLGAITPLGGTAFIIAWIMLMAGVIKS